MSITLKRESQATIIDVCPLCKSAESNVYAQYKEFTWVSCSCGLIYKRSELANYGSDEIYDPSYFKAGDEKHSHAYDRRTRRRIQKSKIQIRHALKYTTIGPLLDIGCSLGYTLKAAKDMGLSGYGIDIAQYAVDRCREQGLVAEIGGLDSIPHADKTFNIVLMKHVLEHTPQPSRALKEAYRALKPGGSIFIAVPHAGYIKARLNPVRSRFFRPDCRGGSEHYVYYTPRTLSQLLELNGFRVKRTHPHLLYSGKSFIGLSAELLVVPFRYLGGLLRTALGLRKEFWIIAVRPRQEAP